VGAEQTRLSPPGQSAITFGPAPTVQPLVQFCLTTENQQPPDGRRRTTDAVYPAVVERRVPPLLLAIV
jgi:hypothetical protein